MDSTVPVGVRVQTKLLDRARELDPCFNFSAYVRRYLAVDFGELEDRVDEVLYENSCKRE